jgi:predicted RNA-binding Zn-ribbon protein involved in translation (DUF1610 family)
MIVHHLNWWFSPRKQYVMNFSLQCFLSFDFLSCNTNSYLFIVSFWNSWPKYGGILYGLIGLLSVEMQRNIQLCCRQNIMQSECPINQPNAQHMAFQCPNCGCVILTSRSLEAQLYRCTQADRGMHISPFYLLNHTSHLTTSRQMTCIAVGKCNVYFIASSTSLMVSFKENTPSWVHHWLTVSSLEAYSG